MENQLIKALVDHVFNECGLVGLLLLAYGLAVSFQLARERSRYDKLAADIMKSSQEISKAYLDVATTKSKLEGILLSSRRSQ